MIKTILIIGLQIEFKIKNNKINNYNIERKYKPILSQCRNSANYSDYSFIKLI